jgi:hypothetical protein
MLPAIASRKAIAGRASRAAARCSMCTLGTLFATAETLAPKPRPKAGGQPPLRRWPTALCRLYLSYEGCSSPLRLGAAVAAAPPLEAGLGGGAVFAHDMVRFAAPVRGAAS